jgi:Flp pilus assembly CpaE family ATPase
MVMPTDDEILHAYRDEYQWWIRRSNKALRQIEICRIDEDDITVVAFVKFGSDNADEKADMLFEQHRDAAVAKAVRKVFEKIGRTARRGKGNNVVVMRRSKSNDDDAA